MRVNYKVDWNALGNMQGSKSLNPKKYLILDAALKIIGSQGLQNLSITEIAKATELSKPLVLYHYETKERILEDLLFYMIKMGDFFTAGISELDDSFENKVKELVKGYFRWYLFNREVSDFLVMVPHLREKSTILKKTYQEGEIQLNRSWEKVFLESLRFRSMEELRISVFGVRSMLSGALIHIIELGERNNYAEYALRLKFNLEALLKVELPTFDF